MRLIENSAARNIFNNLKESESIPSMKDENFNETVLRDFRLFLMDKYGDELYKDVTDEDVNEYFTGMFYDIWDNDDLESANAAEDIIRAEYHLSDKSDYYDDYEYDDGDTNWDAEEEADALERMERRYGSMDESEDSERILARLVKDLPDTVEYKGKTYQAFNVMSNDITGATSKVYYCNMENTPSGDPQESNDYFFVVATLKKTDRGYKGVDHINYVEDLTEGVKIRESVKHLNEGGIYPVEIEEEASQALVNKIAEILGCDSSEDISVDGLELIPAKGFAGGGQYWFRAQVNIGQAGAYHEDFIWKALEAVKDQCPHLYKIYENGTQSGPGSVVTGETNGLEVNYYSTIDIVDDEEVENGLSFEYSNEDLEIAGCDLKTLEAEETPVGDYLCSLVKEHMSELIELLKSYEISEDDYEDTDDLEEYNESTKLEEAKKPSKEKKEDKRVVMQQGNVTCFKENDTTYLVFENESDNEVEHDSEESAMHDFLERVGIDANAELKEK